MLAPGRFFRMTYRFRDIGVENGNVAPHFGSSAKVRYISAAFTAQTCYIDFHIWQIGRFNKGVASE